MQKCKHCEAVSFGGKKKNQERTVHESKTSYVGGGNRGDSNVPSCEEVSVRSEAKFKVRTNAGGRNRADATLRKYRVACSRP